MPLSPGQVLNNRYRIVKLLGQGGFGAVYKAWDLNMERPRALKENLETGEESQRQFKREAQILGDLTHPHLPKVIDHFVIPDQGQYLVMEYVEGEDLEERLFRNGAPLDEAQVLTWVNQVCSALSYLHTQNPPVIHRDIKPANIKIRADGQAMLVDFGIAKMYDPKLRTTVGARAITPGFSPQEQYGLGTTDTRTDIYALGATFYNLVTGRVPPESVQRNLDTRLIPPRQLNPIISHATEAAILKAMEMHPRQRFQSVAEFQAAMSVTGGGGAKEFVSFSPAVKAAAASTHAGPVAHIPTDGQIHQEAVKAETPSPEIRKERPQLPARPALREAATPPTASIPWQLISVQSIGLAIAGLILTFHAISYLGDYVFEDTLMGYYTLVCLLMIIDGIRQPPPARLRKWFEVVFGVGAIVIPAYIILYKGDYGQGITYVFFSILIISLATLVLAGITRDWRVGVLGVTDLLFASQYFLMVQENWDYIGHSAVYLGLFYALAGVGVLINALTRRR